MGVKSKIIEISRKVPETEDFPAVPFHNSEDELVQEIGLPDYAPDDHAPELEFASSNNEDYWEEEAVKSRNWFSITLVSLTAIAFLGWTGFFGWAHLQELQAIPAPARIANLVGLWTIPVALLALIWLLVTRNSSAEATRFGNVATLLHDESQALELRMQAINGEIALARSFLAENARELDSVGRQSAQRLTEAAQQLGTALADADEKAQLLAQVSNAAVTNLEQLRNHLPVVTSAAKDVTNQIGNAGRIAQTQIETLIPAIKQVDETAGEAHARLESLTSKTLQSSSELNRIATEAAITLETAAVSANEQAKSLKDNISKLTANITKNLADSGESLTNKVALQSENLSSLVLTLQSEIDQNVQQSATTLEDKLERLRLSLAGVGDAATSYDKQVDGAIARIGAALAKSEHHISQFDGDATDRVAQLAFAVNALAESSGRLGEGLTASEAKAQSVLSGSERLLLALETASRELDDGMPAAFTRMEERFASTRAAFDGLLNDSALIEDKTVKLCEQLVALEQVIEKQKSAFDTLLSGNDGEMLAHREKIEELSSSLTAARSMVSELAQSANEDVTGALQNIRQTTDEVATATKQILEGELGSIAEKMTEQNRVLLSSAVDEQISRMGDEMKGAIERNIALSETASRQISQQLHQLDEMTTNLEARVGETRTHFVGMDDEGFARRMALLTESLNSAAIDVAKILSNEVTDTAWASYLKGDRGVFTRRAVKLLDNSESKIIANYYDEDIEFREHVSRYIHDFEAMMRVLLSTRDGNAVGITLLSSDVGKLYVALAQAIDRLRN
jgi:predicted  nucleic acid-binding Zn-ribbon protein/predicted transcriptional regulator